MVYVYKSLYIILKPTNTPQSKRFQLKKFRGVNFEQGPNRASRGVGSEDRALQEAHRRRLMTAPRGVGP